MTLETFIFDQDLRLFAEPRAMNHKGRAVSQNMSGALRDDCLV